MYRAARRIGLKQAENHTASRQSERLEKDWQRWMGPEPSGEPVLVQAAQVVDGLNGLFGLFGLFAVFVLWSSDEREKPRIVRREAVGT